MKINNLRIVTGLICAALLQISAVDFLYCQEAPDEVKIIKELNVKNNKTISTETILSKIKTKVGDRFSQEVLNDDLKRLYATEYFTDVSIDVEDYEGGFSVTFVVEEKSVIEDIVFKGNKAFRAQKLKSMMKSKPHEMLNMAILAQDIAEIRVMYIKKGYPLVDVKYELEVDREINKTKLTIIVDEKTRLKVARVNVTGNSFMKTGTIKKILGTKPAWLFNPGVFKDDVLEEDIDKIKSLYDNEGFLDTEVAPKLEYNADQTLIDVTFEINEGKQYFTGDISVKGSIKLDEKELNKNIKMRPGKPFSNRSLRADVIAIKQFYYRYGYMDAMVDVEKTLNEKTENIDITYMIDAREQIYVGKVDIRGNIKTKDVVVRRELRIYPGEKFDGDKIRRSKERLYNLGFFEDVSFDTEPAESPTVKDLIVSVKEAKTGEFSFGGGYSSVDQIVGFVEIMQKNFDILNFPSFMGAGQDLSVRAEIGTVRQNYNVSWTEPWIFGYPYSFGFDLYRTSHKKTTDIGWSYDETRTGGDLRLGKDFTDSFKGNVSYRLEEIKIGGVDENSSQDLKDEEGTNTISSLVLQLTYDTRDNVFNPMRGYYISGAIEDAGGIFLGDKDYVKGTGIVSFYHTFFEKIVLELKARGGLSSAYGSSDEVPVYERFYAGGANTIRGYRERRVGPRDPGSDEPIGGEALAIGNVEVTFPIYEKMIKGAVFCDVGNVWRRAKDFMVGGDYRAGAGVGLRVKTPIGPVNLDYGYPLVKNYEDERTGEFYFSMSRGF